MLIVLTDHLTCPRCGPGFGLVVMVERLERRRVVEGSLGCANCREMFPITEGLADLRFPPRPLPKAFAGAEAPGAPSELAFRLAALVGVSSGPGWVLLAGPSAILAGDVAALVPGLSVVAVGCEVVGSPDREATSRLLIDDQLPLRDGSMRGVALSGDTADTLFDEGLRALAPGARIVLDPAPAQAAGRLERAGLRILLEQDRIMVASKAADR